MNRKKLTELTYFAVVLLALPFALAASDYAFLDSWNSQVSEALNDDVFFKDINAEAFIDGAHDCECHSFDKDDAVIFVVNGEVFQAMEEGDVQEDAGSNIEITVRGIDIFPDRVDFDIDEIRDTLNEGQTKIYTGLPGGNYEITALDIGLKLYEECICLRSKKDSCVRDAGAIHGDSDPLVQICGGNDPRCKINAGTATVKTRVPKFLHSPFGYEYRHCGSSFIRDSEPADNNAYIINQRRILCGSAGRENEIIYLGAAGLDGEISYGRTTDTCPENFWCDQVAADSNKISNAFDEFDINPDDEISSDDICRKKNGQSCSADIECLTGTICTLGFCGGASENNENTTDLEIIKISVAQVVENVDLIKGKKGFIQVLARNNGPLDAIGEIKTEFNGTLLDPVNNSSKLIQVNTTEFFLFEFTPTSTGEVNIKAVASIL